MTETKLREANSATSRANQTFVGPSIRIRGELAGREDLILEGQCEGNISLEDDCLTVGAQGHITGEVRARQVILHGSVQGNIAATQKIEIRRTGRVVGDLVTPSIAIEEGGFLKGSIDISRQDQTPPAAMASAGGATEARAREPLGVIRLREGPQTNNDDGAMTSRTGAKTPTHKTPDEGPVES